MARQNSTGLPYLVRRPDTAKFIYSRELPADLVAHVRGDISVPWSTTGTRTLDGTARVIKMSLKTGDEATARMRWSHVNGQVEALVQLGRVLAQEQTDRGRDPEQTRPVPPEAIEVIAAQARHDLLAEHDRAWIDPTFTSPLAGVVLRLLRKGGVPPTAGTIRTAQRYAQDLLLRDAKDNLVARRPGHLDVPIIETEYGPNSARGHATPKRGELWPSAEEIASLGTPTFVDRVPGEIEARLSENGFDQVSEFDRRAVALALLRAKVSTLEDMQAREAGAPIFTPARPAPATPPPAAAQSKPALSTMRALWIQDRRPGAKEVEDKTRYVQFFIDLFGDCPVDQITSPMVAQYLAQLELCLRNDPHILRGATLQVRVAWAGRAENAAKPRLKRPTINSKGLGGVAAWLEQARRLGHIARNPCERMALEIKAGDVVKRVPYSLQDLTKIFRSGVFDHPVDAFWLSGADHWLPLLGLFTGARLEELGQLLVTDVKVVDGFPCLEITDLPDDDAATSTDAKSIKTPAVRRLVPLHDQLIALGFLDFVEAQRGRGSTRLFPELPRYRGRVTKEWSKKWARFADKHVTRSPAKAFHSFRHLFIARLRFANADANLIKKLVGHAISDVTVNYGVEDDRPFPVSMLYDAAQSFAVPGLDLAHLRRPQHGA